MTIIVDQQIACQTTELPTQQNFEDWVTATLLAEDILEGELTIRLVNKDESQQLNHDYRHQDKPTNVLSFPFSIDDSIELATPLLGDLIICPAILETEAKQQYKRLLAHWAHMVIHGTLHLLNYDHQTPQQSEVMESLEIKLLLQLGYKNPYE